MNVSFELSNKFDNYIEEIFKETENIDSISNSFISLSKSKNKRDIKLFNDNTTINLQLNKTDKFKAIYEVESNINDVFRTVSILDLFEPEDELIEGMFEYIYNLIQEEKERIA